MRGEATGDGSREKTGRSLRLQPSNQAPEEAASSRTGGTAPVRSAQCFRALRRT